MSGDGYTGKAIQDISGIAYTEISILFIHVLFTQATSSNCQRLALTPLVLNKVTNHHAQQNRVNTVSVTGVCAPRQRNASPFSFGTRLCFFCTCGSWLLHFELAGLRLHRTVLFMPSQTRNAHG